MIIRFIKMRALVFLVFYLSNFLGFGQELKSVTLYPTSDSFITNKAPNRTIQSFHEGSHGKEIRLGWDEDGNSMRAIIEFDIASVLPQNPEDSLVLELATLYVLESNTNLHPFTAENIRRQVMVFLLGPGETNLGSFNERPVQSCGKLATSGYNVLEDSNIGFKRALEKFMRLHPGESSLRFRVQFTHDRNVDPEESVLESNMWSFFSMEEERWQPKISMRYKWVRKSSE